MTTINKEVTYALYEDEEQQLLEKSAENCETENLVTEEKKKSSSYKMQIVWRNVIVLIILHALGFLGLSHIGCVKTKTCVFGLIITIFSTMGVQAGAHRLWSHRAYKANFGVRLFLGFFQTMALQNDIYEWCRDHRAHHRFSETDADPHSSSRGFFFSHVGWLLVKKHPDVIRRGKTIDLSDLMADPIVRFQRRFYIPLVLLIWGFLPTYIPVYFWDESIRLSFLTCVMTRYVFSLNLTWLVNSWAHLYGNKPYDQAIAPVEASIRHLLVGEGFHNYHHSFPWDYSASELGPAFVFNPATALIDFFAFMGWAWDLKKVNPKLVAAKMDAKGDQAAKEHYCPTKKGSALKEWFGGVLSLFGPFFLVRYLLLSDNTVQ